MPYQQPQYPNFQVLEDIARVHTPKGYIADIVSPPLFRESISRKGEIEIWDDDSFLVPDDTRRGNLEEASEMKNPEPSYREYITERHARKFTLGNSDKVDYKKQTRLGEDRLSMRNMEKLTAQMKNILEKSLANKLQNTATYASGYSETLGTPITAVSGDPITPILRAISKIESRGLTPTHIIGDIEIKRILQHHVDLLEYMRVTDGRIEDEKWEEIFGLKAVWGRSRYKTEAGVWTPMWQDGLIIAVIDGEADEFGETTEMTLSRTVYSQRESIISYDKPELDHRGAIQTEFQHEYSHELIGVESQTNNNVSIAGYLIDNFI